MEDFNKKHTKWLVGSSKIKKVGQIKRARANAIRILHPPLNSLVFFC